MNETFSDYIDLINTAEDFIRDGWKTRGKRQNYSITPAADAGGSSDDSLKSIAAEIGGCTVCRLASTRTNVVPGEGSINPVVMFIGEGPGADEDRSGRPFVGKAGQYLDKWVSAIGLDRQKDCFIGNIIKCRPPGNRDPLPDEIGACRHFLDRQLALLKPLTIVTLGRFASQVICSSDDGIGRLRNHTFYYNDIPVIPTYHPSAVLRNPELRSAVWDDLRRLNNLIESLASGK